MLLSRCIVSACLAMVFLLGGSAALNAHSVQPVISEYTDHAAGWFEVTNNSALAEVVILEPKSFSIAPDGTGEFRFLDPSIHVELSTTSLRLEPQQTARIFYKVMTDIAPAWLCIYASFSPAKKTQGLTVRMMLPHTVYVYQRLPLLKEAVDAVSLCPRAQATIAAINMHVVPVRSFVLFFTLNYTLNLLKVLCPPDRGRTLPAGPCVPRCTHECYILVNPPQ